MLRLLGAERQVIPAQAKLDRVAERGAADDFHLGAVAEAHLQQAAAKLTIPPDRDDGTAAADPERVQCTGLDRAAVIATGKVTGFLHGSAPLHLYLHP